AEGLEQPTRRTLVKRAVLGLNGAGEAVNAEHATPQDRIRVNVEQDAEPSLLGVGRGADHSSLAGQLSLAADPLGLNVLVLRFLVVGLERAGSPGGTRSC